MSKVCELCGDMATHFFVIWPRDRRYCAVDSCQKCGDSPEKEDFIKQKRKELWGEE